MPPPFSSSTARRRMLLSLALLVGAPAVLATGAGAGARARSAAPSAAGARAFAVALPAPSAGDVTYGVARVRIVAGSRLSVPAGRIRQQSVFAGRVGALSIVARSRSWRALRVTTRVYIVVSRVRGGSAALRDVAFFIVRHKAAQGRLDSANGSIAFTIGNARAQAGSYWVRGVDGRGYATVFEVRNILTTALANWARYVGVLKVVHALDAAAHPVDLGPAPTASPAAAHIRDPGPWTGGQRPSARVVAMYHLIFGALGDPNSYAAVKKDPLVADFIQNELANPALAARWRTVVAQVPLKVPDQYAAAAQEEKRFTRVVAPKITHVVVAFPDHWNSSQEAAREGLLPPTKNTVTVGKVGTGTGTVTDLSSRTGGIDCGPVCSETITTPGYTDVHLKATPDSGSTFSHWNGVECRNLEPGGGLNPAPDTCEFVISSREFVTAVFTATGQPGPPPPPPPTYSLSVTARSEGFGLGTVTSSPPGINCRSSCQAPFAPGASVTLTATADTSSVFDAWTGCDSVAGNTCTVAMTRARNVDALFGYP